MNIFLLSMAIQHPLFLFFVNIRFMRAFVSLSDDDDDGSGGVAGSCSSACTPVLH